MNGKRTSRKTKDGLSSSGAEGEEIDGQEASGMGISAQVAISATLSDPAGTGTIAAAMAWVEGTVLGPLATTTAVIAVAWVGLLMLGGRLDVRRGLTVVVGCFILFGASTIAAGIRTLADSDPVAYTPPPAPTPRPSAPAPPPLPVNPDPYAGASVPTR